MIVSYTNAARAARAELYPAGLAWQLAWSRARELCRSTARTGSTRARSAPIWPRSSSPRGLTGQPLPAAAFSINRPGFKLKVSTAARARLLRKAAVDALAAAR